jgi:TolB-like protein
MLKITKLVCISLLCTALNACSTLEYLKKLNPLGSDNKQAAQTNKNSNDSNHTKLCANDEGIFSTCQDMIIKQKSLEPTLSPINDANILNTDLHFHRLGEYTEQMAVDLQNDVRDLVIEEPIIVASFVHLDSSLQTTNTLGNQLSEFFRNDLQQIGLPVADHKLMGVLDVNGKGDFVFSRDLETYYNHVDIGYVLTGTMLKSSRGLVVNARIINFKTNAVVASASKFLPNLVINGLM